MESLTGILSFNSMLINGTPVPVQGGRVKIYSTCIIHWMGTPPTHGDLESKLKMDIDCSGMFIGNSFMTADELMDSFDFEIQTLEVGKKITGQAFMPSIHLVHSNGHIFLQYPVIMPTKFEVIDI
jgi:hypothetical protein